MAGVGEEGSSEGRGMPGTGCIQRAYEMLDKRFDEQLGGFGNAPKFPQPSTQSESYMTVCTSVMCTVGVFHGVHYLLIFLVAILNFLLRLYSRYPESSMGERALQMTLHTLKAMANGGMHDHVGQVS